MSDCRRNGVRYKRHKVVGDRCIRCKGWVVENRAEALKAAIDKVFKDSNAKEQ